MSSRVATCNRMSYSYSEVGTQLTIFQKYFFENCKTYSVIIKALTTHNTRIEDENQSKHKEIRNQKDLESSTTA